MKVIYFTICKITLQEEGVDPEILIKEGSWDLKKGTLSVVCSCGGFKTYLLDFSYENSMILNFNFNDE